MPPNDSPSAEVAVLGRMRNASNATFLVSLDDDEGLAIYKPGRGERPLWDFPPGLYRREVAAYVLSEALGLHIVPPTVLRPDAPLGEGSLQWFVNADFAEHYFSLYAERPELHDQLRAIAVFDAIANNTDRKSGHCLLEIDGDGRRSRVGDRQRTVLLDRRQAAHRDLGVRRRTASRPTSPGRGAGRRRPGGAC